MPAGGAVAAFAPAKINLYLHVVGRRDDGYHLLDSLVVFADIGDRITAAPAAALTLRVGGPEAAALSDLGEDNLVLRAACQLRERAGIAAGAALHLDKHLPVASGIGGGSSDAAAALRALAALWGCPLDAPGDAAWVAALGADVPACLAARPVWVGGIGERLEPAGALPELAIVLANPRIALPTAAVFRARRGGFGAAGRFAVVPRDAGEFVRALADCRNDLAEAAIALVPEIGMVLDRLARLPGALLARMSGSGATCFALFAARERAERAGGLLAAAHPEWWVRAGAVLAAPPPVGAAQPGS